MANTRQIKRRIGSAKNISKITKAMEMVAASKMKKAQDQALQARPYSLALRESLRKVSEHTDESLHPLLSNHNIGDQVLIMITTDKGLCGSLNTNVFKLAISWKKAHPAGKIIAVGKKAVTLCRLAGWEVLAQFTNLPEIIQTKDILPITELISSKFLTKELQSVDIVYTDFINTLSQKPVETRILPISAETDNESDFAAKGEYSFEPSAKSLLSFLLPYFIENMVYQILLESRASEHSARMVAMKNASENAGELVEELKLIFNKSRQAAITNELLEITTATISLQS